MSAPLPLAERIARRFAAFAPVKAVALGGSFASGSAGGDSDLDVYVFSQDELPGEVRLAVGAEFSPDAQVIDFWGPGMEWDDPQTGMHVDTVYFTPAWIGDQLDRVLLRHEASLGYTTCF